ncbi:MAG: tRNA (guanosine(37)-N1)-methyltransferase TrmD [Xanthomonadaceae bacterium]|nr:tRNA (guanosine(37)-N1)-methyltransferase TrmD [Rhodospirillaceae bacterium]NIA17583.1 tRNA (guanosine(37)-N1)-methyltransferase TrmD [Xanthomonadaceae bacterium]
MKFNILTIFPNIFNSYFSESILKKAQDKKIININIINIRDFTNDKHKTVDNPPYGGGPGMVMKIEPIYKALRSLKKKNNKKRKIILLTPAGKQFNQKIAKKYSKLDELVFICGRYEGIDARVEKLVDEKISLGPFILNGGEIAAISIIETVSRLIPNVLGNKKSLIEETFSSTLKSNKSFIEYPQYTRPEIFKINNKKYKVPKILLSGNHKKIIEWKKKKSKFK